jgi:hypothetical protein
LTRRRPAEIETGLPAAEQFESGSSGKMAAAEISLVVKI